ncbi:MAG: DUF2240 family protein, partial [Thermoplasmata archaeon]
ALEIAFNAGCLPLRPDFIPSKRVIEYAPAMEPLFLRIVNHIVCITGQKKNEVVSAINKKKDKLGVTPEAAALITAVQMGVDIYKFVYEAEESLFAVP